jgi:hypothetical protein
MTKLAEASRGSLAEQAVRKRVRCGVEKPDHRHRFLLRASCKRPRSRRDAEQRYELAPFHSITSSAGC